MYIYIYSFQVHRHQEHLEVDIPISLLRSPLIGIIVETCHHNEERQVHAVLPLACQLCKWAHLGCLCSPQIRHQCPGKFSKLTLPALSALVSVRISYRERYLPCLTIAFIHLLLQEGAKWIGSYIRTGAAYSLCGLPQEHRLGRGAREACSKC